MSLYRRQNRILLAGPSLLYAPVYLAKIEQLSYAFRWVQLDHPNRNDHRGERDPVFFKLLDSQQDNDVILAIADPFRLRYSQHTGHTPECAAVIGGLIQRTCLWLIANGSNFDHTQWNGGSPKHYVKDMFNQVVVHRQEMSSFALLASVLRRELGITTTSTPTHEQIRQVKRLLFRNARLGEEHVWAKWRHRYLGANRPFAYVSGDRTHALHKEDSAAEKLRFFEHAPECERDTLFTALVTRADLWNNSGDKSFLQEIVRGINRGVEIIYDSPDWAARRLFRDLALMKRLPGAQTVDQIRDYLVALTDSRVKAYVDAADLKVNGNLCKNALGLHTNADPFRDNCSKVSDSDLEKAFAPLNVQLSTNSGQASSSAPEPATTPTQTAIQISGRAKQHYEETKARVPVYLARLRFALGIVSAFVVLLCASHHAVNVAPEFPLKSLLGWLQFPVSFSVVSNVGVIRSRFIILLSISAIWLLLPALRRALDTESEQQGLATLWIGTFLPLTFAISALVWTIADWNTMIGALANWSVIFYAFYKYASAQWTRRLTLRERVGRFNSWASVRLHRCCHCWVEWWNKDSLSYPYNFPWLIKLKYKMFSLITPRRKSARKA